MFLKNTLYLPALPFCFQRNSAAPEPAPGDYFFFFISPFQNFMPNLPTLLYCSLCSKQKPWYAV
jgi:hypothetical protein